MSRRLALLGVSDKEGLVEFARGLLELGFELAATGGTASELHSQGMAVTPVSELTGMEEMLEGRVKTLHPALHAAILARRGVEADMATLGRLGYRPIDLVVVNLYPFAEAVGAGAAPEAILEAVDIGGPTLLRAAAKNFASVAVVSSPSQYQAVLAELRQGDLQGPTRRRLAAEAFRMISAYDALVGEYLASGLEPSPGSWPEHLAVAGRLLQPLRYGENPHQPGALYQVGAKARGLAATARLQGDELSYTNWLDVDSARRLVHSLAEPAAVVVKHGNPCGVALAPTLGEAFERAYGCDPRSAYGGVVGLNREVDQATGALLAGHFLEVLVAPAWSREALAELERRPRIRVLTAPPVAEGEELEVRSIDGALLAQLRDEGGDDESQFRTVSRRGPSEAEWRQLRLAWAVVRAVKSNAIVLCRDDRAVGIGAGQMSRVEPVELAVQRAGERSPGSVLASDGFFPMADGLEVAIRAGVTAAIHPGGSKRDQEVIALADEAGMALVATGRRHFRH